MLYGMTSRLPVFQNNYSGSLKDVTTLESTITEFKAVVGDRPILTVMDKGFFSSKNVDMLLDKAVPFLVSIPFTSAFAKQQLISVRDVIDQAANIIRTSEAPIRGLHRFCPWGKSGKQLHVHVFYNPQAALTERNALFEHVTTLNL
jgi:hypothetical protein